MRRPASGPSDRVAFLEKNGPEFFETAFAVAKLNAVIVGVNWRLAPTEIAQIINDAQAKVLVVGAEFVAHVEKIEDELETITKYVAIGGHARWDDYEQFLGAQPATDPGAEPKPEDVAIQMYTSGTTGLPKGVMLTNANFFSGVMNVTESWKFDKDSVNIAVMPMFHIAGSGYSMVGLYHGCQTVVLRDVDPARIVQLIPEFQVTNAFFVPAVIQFLLITPGVDTADFSTLRAILYGASPITDAVLTKAMEVFGCGFIQVYGMTETTGAITQLEPEDHDPVNRPELLRSCGRPYPWVEMRLVDPDTGADVADGTVGELWTRSPQNMKGYWANEEATKATIDDEGWLRTGDAGYRDAEGFLFLHDRVKDMIVTGGENVYPAEVENVLAEASRRRRRRRRGRARREVGRGSEGRGREARRQRGVRQGRHHVRPRAPRRLQAAEDRRLHRRAPAQPVRQVAQARDPRPVLGRRHPPDRLARERLRNPPRPLRSTTTTRRSSCPRCPPERSSCCSSLRTQMLRRQGLPPARSVQCAGAPCDQQLSAMWDTYLIS